MSCSRNGLSHLHYLLSVSFMKSVTHLDTEKPPSTNQNENKNDIRKIHSNFKLITNKNEIITSNILCYVES